MLEQCYLIEEHFPPGGGGAPINHGDRAAGDRAVAPLPEPEPPKPKPAAVTQNAQLADIRAKISNVQRILDQPPAEGESSRLMMMKEESKEADNPIVDSSHGKLISSLPPINVK